MIHARRSLACLAVTAVSVVTSPLAAQSTRDVEIKPVKVADGVYMLTGSGGNIGLSVGDDGVFMIDDQFAPLTEKILAAVSQLSRKPVHFLVNTHWHGDHVGGNENMGKAGAIIIAHDNVRKRMSTDQFMAAFDRSVPASPAGALPVVTFTDAVTFHFNDDELHVFHVTNAHTDGDAIIHFREANVFHMGDTFFNGMYPFIDTGSGGSIDGMIEAADEVLARANRRTKFIPGHGPLGGRKDLRAYRDMLETVSERIHKMVDDGKSRDEVIAAKPTSELDGTWGNGFMKPDRWVGIVYDGMTR